MGGVLFLRSRRGSIEVELTGFLELLGALNVAAWTPDLGSCPTSAVGSDATFCISEPYTVLSPNEKAPVTPPNVIGAWERSEGRAMNRYRTSNGTRRTRRSCYEHTAYRHGKPSNALRTRTRSEGPATPC